jgi:hypothetical protein
MEERVTQPRVTVIEGRRTLVVERTPPLPPELSLLLNGGRDAGGRFWPSLRVASREPLVLGGARTECAAQDHRLTVWLHGFYTGSDGISRTLRLLACRDCGSVCVRDVSFDTLAHLPPGRSGPRRRHHVLAWYSGSTRDAYVTFGLEARPGRRCE